MIHFTVLHEVDRVHEYATVIPGRKLTR